MPKTRKISIGIIICVCILGCLFLYSSSQARKTKPKEDQVGEKNISKNKDKKKKQTKENDKKENLGTTDKTNEEAFTKIQLSVSQSVQENSYFCVPASLQMVLRYHGIEMSQSKLANEMNTDTITGTEYIDLAHIANKYLFNNENVGLNDSGYHVQTLNRYDTDPEIANTFEKRVKLDISTNDPVFAAIDVNALYPNLASGNHLVVITGYAMHSGTNEIAYYYYIDPSYVIQDEVYGGLKTATRDEIINAIITNIEPAYIW